MNKLDILKKKKAEQEQEQARLLMNLDKLKQERTTIDAQIIEAIDADRLADVDTLTAKETDLDNRIRTAERILERKKENNEIATVEAIALANNEDMRKRQSEIDSLVQTAEKQRRTYLGTLVKAAETIQAANYARAEYMAIAGIEEDRIGAFSYVNGGRGEPVSNWDMAIINDEIIPGNGCIVHLLQQ